MNRITPAQSFWSRHAREILMLALLVLGIHDVFGAHGVLAMRRTQTEMEQLHSDIARLNDENGKLTSEVKSLKTDPKSIERIAREEMGLARPGEMIFKLPSAPGADIAATPNAH